ncbi:MAG: Smr/MutS family endonuclease [Gammaproteobacteria bacterium]|nr:Smr/MutS family endonuclease [Gammaproteobacteria bacterium]
MNDQNNDQNDDKDLFRSLYGDIERVDDDRVPEWRQKPRSKPRYQHKPPEDSKADVSPWPELAQSESGEDESSAYRANGVQDKLVRKLRRGQLKPQASIDLHGMTRTVALQELQAFITECRSRSIHSIHIVHGKGLQSDGGKAVLKPSVAIWLKQMPAVLAYCPAQIHDGGDGALYVLLKK